MPLKIVHLRHNNNEITEALIIPAISMVNSNVPVNKSQISMRIMKDTANDFIFINQ